MNILLPALFLFLASMGTAASQEHETQTFSYYVHDWRTPGFYQAKYTIRNDHRSPWVYEAGTQCFKWDINYLRSIGINIPEYRELDLDIFQLGSRTYKDQWSYYTIYEDGTQTDKVVGYTPEEVQILTTSLDDFVYAQQIRIASFQFSHPMWCDEMYTGG